MTVNGLYPLTATRLGLTTSFGQLNMNRSAWKCCFQAEAIKTTMSLASVMRPVEAASSGVSQDEENMEQRQSQLMMDMSRNEKEISAAVSY